MARAGLVVVVSAAQDGLRLDQVLGATQELSRTLARRLIGQGAVWVDGRRTKVMGRRVRSGQRIEVHVPKDGVAAIRRVGDGAPRAVALDVIYRDERFVAIDKPAGMSSAPTPGRTDGVVTTEAARILGLKPPPQPVHRLDRDTSGVMVLALSREAVRLAARLQEDGRVVRRYLALSAGRPRDDLGIWNAPLARDPRRRGRWRVWEGGRPSRTGYRVVGPSRFDGFWLLELELHTGRTHQIRLHMAHAGCPVVGDPWYGTAGPSIPASAESWARVGDGRPRMFLHSRLWEVDDDALSVKIESVPDWLAPLSGK